MENQMAVDTYMSAKQGGLKFREGGPKIDPCSCSTEKREKSAVFKTQYSISRRQQRTTDDSRKLVIQYKNYCRQQKTTGDNKNFAMILNIFTGDSRKLLSTVKKLIMVKADECRKQQSTVKNLVQDKLTIKTTVSSKKISIV